jgi:hypothetical protein
MRKIVQAKERYFIMASSVTPKGIEAAIKVIGKVPDQSLLNYWTTILTPKESIYDYVEGVASIDEVRWNVQVWKIILTQKRLIFTRKPLFGSEEGKDLTLRRIKGIETKGLIFKKIYITYNQGVIRLEIVSDQERFANMMIQLRFGYPFDDTPNLGWYSTMPSQMIQRSNAREPIPAHVRRIVWERDDGQCVQCGNTRDLHFDHIIPVSLGGGNSVENIQILCQHCNLRKSNRIDG